MGTNELAKKTTSCKGNGSKINACVLHDIPTYIMSSSVFPSMQSRYQELSPHTQTSNGLLILLFRIASVCGIINNRRKTQSKVVPWRGRVRRAFWYSFLFRSAIKHNYFELRRLGIKLYSCGQMTICHRYRDSAGETGWSSMKYRPATMSPLTVVRHGICAKFCARFNWGRRLVLFNPVKIHKTSTCDNEEMQQTGKKGRSLRFCIAAHHTWHIPCSCLWNL